MATQVQPYSRFAKPFTIGLNLLNDDTLDGQTPSVSGLFQPDHKFAEYIRQKQELFATCEQDVFLAEANTLEAQYEVLNLVLELTGAIVEQDTLTCPVNGDKYRLDDYQNKPLMLASLLVQDDLVLMRRKADGWTLVAASLCFPSSWKLSDKFGKPLDQIHQPVPGASNNLDPMIQRIFDNLRPEMPVWRENWSIYADDNLRHSTSESTRTDRGKTVKTVEESYLRREYQTLHRLPESRDILFTIKIMIEPLEIIEEQNDPAAIAATLLRQIEAMSREEKSYKGLDRKMAKIETYLRELAAL